MQFSPQQEQAMVRVKTWLDEPFNVGDDAQVFYLAGYAGTGKTTIARHLADQSNTSTQFCAYTGKAALVMKRAGCANARTIHSLIYDHKHKSGVRLKAAEDELAGLIVKATDNPDLEIAARITALRVKVQEEREKLLQPAFELKEDSDIHNVGLIVADECSMIDARMADHLMSFGKKILVLGDPAQLPPVNGEGYFTQRDPDFTLTEIHRQAADNPIIAMATRVREGGTLDLGAYGSSKVIVREGSTKEDWFGGDQILCGRNATRRMLNLRRRKAQGIETMLPVPGDRLICLRNDHEAGLLNGSIWETQDVIEENADQLILTVDSLDGMGTVSCTAHTATFQGRQLDWHSRRDAQEFDHAIAITVHKAQGSQWDAVTIVEETWPNMDAKRWLYTAITRAADRVTIIRG